MMSDVVKNTHLAADDAAAPEPAPLPRISLRRALMFPFTQSNWPQALAYIGAIQFVPVLGYLIIRGWRFEIAQRIGSGASEVLPDWRHAIGHLKQGTLLLSATIVHYIPMYAILAWPRWGIIWGVLELLEWAYVKFFTDLQSPPLMEVLMPALQSLALFVAVLLVMTPITSAIIESATQRYAQTGRVAALFEVWHSIRLACSDLGDVLRIEIGIWLLSAVVFLISVLLMLTVGGSALIPPIMIPVYMWTRGALMGQWIAKNLYEEALVASGRS